MTLSAIVSILHEDIGVKILASVILGTLILYHQKKFLFWIPFLPFSGIWTHSAGNPPALMFVNSYIEIILVTFFLMRCFMKGPDKMSLCILMMAFLAIPSFMNAGEHMFLSIFLFICLLSGAGVYRLFLDEMEEMLSSRLVDAAVLMLLILGISMKFYEATRIGIPVVFARGGSLGSNFVAGLLIPLLPVTRRRWVVFLAIMFLCANFSKGIYAALIVYGIVWIVFVSPYRGGLSSAAVAAVVAFIYLLVKGINMEGYYSIEYFLNSRLRLSTSFSSGSFLAVLGDLLKAGVHDERVTFWKLALTVAREYSFLGVGLGGSMWEFVRHGFPPYSNFHNVYLTVLAEGGLLFFIGVVSFLAYLLYLSFRISRPVFAGLLTWCFYALFNAELYSVGGFATCPQYYTLLFLAAYLVYKQEADSRFEKQLSPAVDLQAVEQ